MFLFRRLSRYIFAFNATKQLFNALLPKAARRKIASSLDLDAGPFNRPIDIVNLISIQSDSYLAVYIKRYGMDVGPGVSLYVLENEILRFDCFDNGRGHYHSLPCLSILPSNERIDVDANTIEAQIDEAAAKITGNYAVHLAKHFRRRIRDFRFDQASLETAVAEASDVMLAAHQSSRAPAHAQTDAFRTDKASHRSHSTISR